MARKSKKNVSHPDQLAFDFKGQSRMVATNPQVKLKALGTEIITYYPKTLSGEAELDISTSDSEAPLYAEKHKDDCLRHSEQSIASSYKERADFNRSTFPRFVYVSLISSVYILIAHLKIPLGDALNSISYFDDIPNNPVSIGFVAMVLLVTSAIALYHYSSYRYDLRQSYKYRQQGELLLPDSRHIVALFAVAHWGQYLVVVLLVVYCLYISSDEMWQAIQYIKVYLIEFDPNWPAKVSPAHAA